MAELNIINPSLSDILSRTDPNGSIAPIIEVAEKLNPTIQHANIIACNDGTKHKRTIRTGIPEPTFRLYNQGVQPTKSQTAQVSDATGMVEDYLEVDQALADLGGRAASFRATETIAKIQGFNNFINYNIFYGNTVTNPAGFTGLDARYNDPNVDSGRQLVNALGTGSNNASIWFVTWGAQGCSLLHPDGTPFGFEHKDLGVQTKEMGSGKLMQVYRDHYKWNIGLTIGDWRSCSRICNIDVQSLTKNLANRADLLDLMIDAEELLDTSAKIAVNTQGNLVEGKTVIYTTRTIAKFLRKQALNKANVNLTVDQVAGKRVTMWGEHEVHRIDSLLDTEAAITGF